MTRDELQKELKTSHARREEGKRPQQKEKRNEKKRKETQLNERETSIKKGYHQLGTQQKTVVNDVNNDNE